MVKVRDDIPQTREGSLDVVGWLQKTAANKTTLDIKYLSRVLDYCQEHGSNVLTRYNISCLRQGLETAEILIQLGADSKTIAAAFLYFIIRNTKITTADLPNFISDDVIELINGVSQLDLTKARLVTDNEQLAEAQRHKLRKLLLAVISDIRVVIIKLAERLSSMRACTKLSSEMKRSIALDVREIYVPIANRLGIGQIKWEMEDFTFRFLDSDVYKRIAKQLDEKRLTREHYIQELIMCIHDSLSKQGIQAKVNGRVKHIYSIWRKMVRKHIDFDEIYDVRAVRIIVNKLQDCYWALGVIHGLWQHIPKEFDDYIANPKENGYQSLHTAVHGPKGKTVEIQIRTEAMHDQAELGVAAHWQYKEGKSQEPEYQKKISQIRQLLDIDEQLGEGDDPKHSVISELFKERIYALSPAGEVIDLPAQSTAIDFAYHIHTDVGHCCRGAKVNGKMVPLTHKLESGDQVEILTAKEGGPSRDWLNTHQGYVASSRARSKIHVWFRQLDRDSHIRLGREILERELKRLGFANTPHTKISERLKFQTVDELLQNLGSGETKIGQVINSLQEQSKNQKSGLKLKKASKPSKSGVTISGVGDLVCSYAKCCHPVPGEPIVGYITIGRGITIHRHDCINVLSQRRDDERLIEVDWGVSSQAVYPVSIQITALDRQGLLKDITTVLNNLQVNVIGMQSVTGQSDHMAIFDMKIEIKELHQLNQILDKVLQLPNILSAKRTDSQ